MRIGDELLGGVDVDAIRVVLAEREMLDCRSRGIRVDIDIILERPGDLCAQMPALVEVVHEHATDELRPTAAPVSVLELLECIVHGIVGHLAADHSRFHLAAIEEGAKRRFELFFLLHNERRALVIAYVRGIGSEGLQAVVLVVTC